MKKLGTKQKIIVFISIILITSIVGVVVSLNIIKINISKGKYNTANNNSSSSNLLPEYIKEGITLGGVTGTLVDLDTSDATATAMDITYGKTAYVDGKKIEGLFVPRSSLKVGDYVEYTADTSNDYLLESAVSGYTSNQTIPQDTELKWQIFSINNDGTIDLISDTTTKTKIYFKGALGYNNGVYILNDICKKQYSNKNLETESRSIKLEDYESKLNEDGIYAKNTFTNNRNIKNGDSGTFNGSNLNYPSLYAQENGSGIDTVSTKKDGIDVSDSYYTAPTKETYKKVNSTLTVTQNSYYFEDDVLKNYFNEDESFKLLHGDKENITYWFASRNSTCGILDAGWGLRVMGTRKYRKHLFI